MNDGGRPLCILFATARYLPERGGTEIHTHEVAKRLANRGVDVTVASTSRRGGFERDSYEGLVRIRRVRAWPSNRDYYAAPGLVRVLRDHRPDMIHCQGYHTLVAPLVMLVALCLDIPYVVTLHSGGHSSGLRHRLRPVQGWVLRPLLKRAQKLISVSSFEADLFSRRLLLARDEFAVIPNGVDLPAPPLGEAPSGAPLILSLGRVESYKGHQRVVEALPALNRARPGTRLRVVGSGGYERQLRRLAERLGVAALVEIAPIAADDRAGLAGLLGQAGVAVSLSGYESQGVAIQEALALGRRLVVSSDSALGELQRYPNVRTLGPQAGREEVAAAVLELLEAPLDAPPTMPTWDACAAALLALYEESLSDRR